MERLKTLFAELQSRFQALTPRERTLVSVAGGAVSVFILFVMLFSFASTSSSIQRRTEEKLLKLRDAQALAENYAENTRQREATERQLSTNAVQLISYLEEKGTAAGLEIPTMNPKGDVPLGDGKIIESSVELTFTDVPIRKFYDFLSNVERGQAVVKVKFIRIEPHPANETLTAWTTVSTYKLKQQ